MNSSTKPPDPLQPPLPEQHHPSPAERFAVPVIPINLSVAAAELRRTTESASHGRRQVTLSKHGGATIALFVFDAGATLAPHSTSGTVTIQVISGTLSITAADSTAQYTAGSLLILSADVRHAVTALTDSVMLLHVSLTPAAISP